MVEDHNDTDSTGRDGDSDLTRREMIKLGTSAAIAVAVTGLDANASSQAPPGKAPLFFTMEEFALVERLTELIIPWDYHSRGAREAQVTGYIDFRLSESFEEQPKALWRDGLKLIEQLSQAMNGKPFLASSPEQQTLLLTRISQNEAKPVKPEELFFKELKSRTARAYYSSNIGIRSEMEYKGNVSLREFVGYDAT